MVLQPNQRVEFLVGSPKGELCTKRGTITARFPHRYHEVDNTKVPYDARPYMYAIRIDNSNETVVEVKIEYICKMLADDE